MYLAHQHESDNRNTHVVKHIVAKIPLDISNKAFVWPTYKAHIEKRKEQ
jgi:hypothetical protein